MDLFKVKDKFYMEFSIMYKKNNKKKKNEQKTKHTVQSLGQIW